MRNNIQQSYSDFILNLESKLYITIDEYHKDRRVAITYYNMLKSYLINDDLYSILDENTIDSICVPQIEKIICKFKNISQINDILKILKSLLFRTIPTHKNNIITYETLISIDYRSYSNMINDYLRELVKPIFLGEHIKIRNLGNMFIATVPRKGTKQRLDYNETRKYKKLYEEQGIKKDYRVYRNNSNYTMIFLTRSMNSKNMPYYHYEPTDVNNYDDRLILNYYKSNPTSKEIVDNDLIGNVQKMNSFLNCHEQQRLKYISNGTELCKR